MKFQLIVLFRVWTKLFWLMESARIRYRQLMGLDEDERSLGP